MRNDTLSPAKLDILQHEAGIAARRLSRKLRLPHQDFADLKQEFLLDIIARIPAYDPARGTLGAFAGTITANRASQIAQKIRRERSLFGFSPISLDTPVAGDEGALMGEFVPENKGLSSLFGQSSDSFGQAEQRIDIERALGRIDRRDGILCASLSCHSITELAARGFGHRGTIYRRVNRIRNAFYAHGLNARRDTFAAA